jgi:GNAT superfamily N-acetyltransferase
LTVRIATIEDFPIAIKLASKFVEEAYGDWSNFETVYGLVVDLIKDDDKVFLLCEDKGFLAGVINKFILGPHRMAVELGWYVKPEHRGEKIGKDLMDGFEDWAKIMSCILITMISIDDEVGKYYEKRGYKLYERTYMKEL